MRASFVLLLGCLSGAAMADDRALHVRRTATPVVIDGTIDSVWSMADSTGDFFQLSPFYRQTPKHRTSAKVLSTDDALYCCMVCYEPRDEIQTLAGILDQADGEVVSIMLDTFNDRKSAYKFAIAASGVRSDCRLLDDARDRDYSWDGVWFGATKVYDWGFVAEIEIPYRSIRYDGAAPSWGLDFDRWIVGSKEDLYWSQYEQNEGQRISKFGRLVFDDVDPAVRGLNLEIYPVGIAKAKYLAGNNYDVNPDAGIDIFFNPSEQLTFQMTGNPDFAQIEADPFAFNISRYETYYDERRPFFTEGNEIFTASGKQRNTGFYRPLELLYTRRIGKLLPDGSQVPLVVGTKAFGRLGEWQYGAFYARTGETDYRSGDLPVTESRASFVAGRIKKGIFENSTVGALFAGKTSTGRFNGVLDVDGAVRTSEWQLSYQLARSMRDGRGDFAGSAGFVQFGKHWLTFSRVRAIGSRFDINDVGYVPWSGTTEFVTISGPVWLPDSGIVSQILLYAGPALNYKDAEVYTDRALLVGFNMQFRSNWGFEIDFTGGESKDAGIRYSSTEVDISSWYEISPRWDASLSGGYAHTYNFPRNYLAFYTWLNSSIGWKVDTPLEVGTSYNMYVEGKPGGGVENITYNARPFVSLTPVNDLNLRLYFDNTYDRASDKLEEVTLGFLFSFNFRPKSWIYFAYNDAMNRSLEFDALGNPLPRMLHVIARAAVIKVKYLYYL